MNDDKLDRLLREAPSELGVPQSFGREVWTRIEAEEGLTIGAFAGRISERFFAWIARPVPALVMTAMCIALGAFVGTMAGRSESGADAVTNEWAYVRSINPLDRHPYHARE